MEEFRDRSRRLDPRAGRLLVAEPILLDPNFARTVVFLIDHDENGSLGVVLNRPGSIEVADIVPEWAPHVTSPPVVFVGGPVRPEGAICVARRGPVDVDHVGAIDGFHAITETVGIVDLHRSPGTGIEHVDAMRVFGGYAGWSAGQLDGELAAGGWFVVESADLDLFTADAEHLWRDVLARQSGPLRAIAHFPEDPTVN